MQYYESPHSTRAANETQRRVEVPKLCSEDRKGSATSTKGIRGNISGMANVKFVFLIKSNNVLL
jgi:hypothetical protein